MYKGREQGRSRRTEDLAAEATTATEATDAEPPDHFDAASLPSPPVASCCSSCRYLCCSPPADQPQRSSAASASALGPLETPCESEESVLRRSYVTPGPHCHTSLARVGRRRAASREFRDGGTRGEGGREGRTPGLARRGQEKGVGEGGGRHEGVVA